MGKIIKVNFNKVKKSRIHGFKVAEACPKKGIPDDFFKEDNFFYLKTNRKPEDEELKNKGYITFVVVDRYILQDMYDNNDFILVNKKDRKDTYPIDNEVIEKIKEFFQGELK